MIKCCQSIVMLLIQEAVFRQFMTSIKKHQSDRQGQESWSDLSRHQDASMQLKRNNVEARPRGTSDPWMLSYYSLYLLWHIKCPNSLCFTPGAYTVTDCSIEFSVLIVLFSPKIERLSWAFVCLQMLSPIGKGSIFGFLTVKVDTIFSCCACTKPVHERCFFFKCVFADEPCSVPACFYICSTLHTLRSWPYIVCNRYDFNGAIWALSFHHFDDSVF